MPSGKRVHLSNPPESYTLDRTLTGRICSSFRWNFQPRASYLQESRRAVANWFLRRDTGRMSFSPLLFFHIGAGTTGLLSGAVTMSFRKGSRGHRVAGNIFFVSMLGMSAAGAIMALMKSQPGNVFGGILTFYLVATAWVTARRRERGTGIFDWVALLAALAVGISISTFGVQAANSPSGSKDGVPAAMYFLLASVALLSAAGDVRMLVRGGVFGAQRITRHLWRMCFALFIASGSIFLARPHLFPAVLSRTHLLVVAGILPLILMIFWLLRVRFTGAYKRMRLPADLTGRAWR
jgi:uncharacterized membrane protein